MDFSEAVSMKTCIYLSLTYSSCMHHDRVSLAYIAPKVISPNAGAISTSTEFLFFNGDRNSNNTNVIYKSSTNHGFLYRFYQNTSKNKEVVGILRFQNG